MNWARARENEAAPAPAQTKERVEQFRHHFLPTGSVSCLNNHRLADPRRVWQELKGTEKNNNKKPNISMKTKILLSVATLALSTWVVGAADVAANYEKTCVKCHGADGKGQTKMGLKVGVKDMTDAAVQSSFTDDQAFKTIKEGKKDKEGKIQMKPIEGASDDEIKELIQYVRKFKK